MSLSFIFGLIVIYFCYSFKKYSQDRFIVARKPTLIFLYCIAGSIPSLLIVSPFKIGFIVFHDYIIKEDSCNHMFIWWLLNFLHEIFICSMSIITALRCWLLYYDHSYELSVVDKNWRGVINPNDTNFWLQHKKTWYVMNFLQIVIT